MEAELTMKIKRLLLALVMVPLLGACAKEQVYQPKQGGIIDTLHNEVHVPNLKALNEGGFDFEKTVGKTYITDDDGFKYIWDAETEQYVLATETNTTINFYFDANQTTRMVPGTDGFPVQIDAPIYVVSWFMTKPLGACPEEIDTEAELKAIGALYGFEPKQNYQKFVGFSLYPSCLGDKEHLWNFEKDFKQQAVTNLYGIWVEE